MTVKLAFVFQTALGWRTYARHLRNAVNRRSDVEPLFIELAQSKIDTLFWKRTNMSYPDRIFRHVDPINGFKGRAGSKIRRDIADFSPHCVHFAGQWPAAAIAYQNRHIPFTVSLDSTRSAIRSDLRRGSWVAADDAREAYILKRASFMFPMSTWARDSIVRDLGGSANHTLVIPPSIDVGAFQPNRGSGCERLQLIFIGSDFLRKGGDRLCKWVTGPLAGKVDLHVVSANASTNFASDHIILHGRVDNQELVTELLPRMDAICHPTLSDMSSFVLAEAAAAGLGAVASRVGGIPDVVEHNKTGILCDPRDDQAFVEALKRLTEDRDFNRTLGLQGRVKAERDFDESRNFTALIDHMIQIQG
jgi:glycosyltransferase involved in cell wall biosynthesis